MVSTAIFWCFTLLMCILKHFHALIDRFCFGQIQSFSALELLLSATIQMLPLSLPSPSTSAMAAEHFLKCFSSVMPILLPVCFKPKGTLQTSNTNHENLCCLTCYWLIHYCSNGIHIPSRNTPTFPHQHTHTSTPLAIIYFIFYLQNK